ncbi:MAG: hypothetical protein F4Y35_03325 [Chloroflexi bacterium]|nr:hypothetical protein [Chloroflexota bacterium]
MPPSESEPLHVLRSPLNVEAAISNSASSTEQIVNLQTASVLVAPTEVVVPTEEGPEQTELAFPELTRDVLQFIETCADPAIKVEALVRDEEYIEVSYNSETLIIPEMVTFSISVAQILIPIVASFVKRRLVDRFGTQKGSTVNSRIHVKSPTGDLILYAFDGPADTYERTLLTALTAATSTDEDDNDGKCSQDNPSS